MKSFVNNKNFVFYDDLNHNISQIAAFDLDHNYFSEIFYISKR